MRTRVTIFDDAGGDSFGPPDDMPIEYAARNAPVVVQSLDVPMVGRPDPGPAQADGDIRIPGSTMRIRITFLDDETGDAVARPYSGPPT